MKNHAFFVGLVFFWVVVSAASAEILGTQAETAIQARLDGLKIGNTVIDLNVRISIPDNTAAGIPGVELFGTLIRPNTVCAPLYAEGKQIGRAHV
jgi:hypothetical protein